MHRRRATIRPLSELLSPAARRVRGEHGFSVIEVTIAMAVFALVATFMSHLLAGGMKGVLLGKRREVATQEANRLLEIARSLSFDAIGLVESDPTIDTDTENISLQGGALSYRPNTVWEPLIWSVSDTNHPFDPHIRNVVRGATKLTDHIYVTGVDSDGDDEVDLKRVTVRVAWEEAGTAGPVNEVRAQTLINESGLVPCQQPCDVTGNDAVTPLTGDAFTSGGALKIDSALLGLSAPVHVTLPTSDGTSTFRLVSDTSCTTRSAAIQATNLVDLPGYSVTTSADNDAATEKPSDPPAQTSTGVLTIPGGPVSSLLGATIGSPVSCDATTDPLAVEEGRASALSALNAQTNVVGLGGLLNWLLTLASVSAQPVSQAVEHETVAGQREVASSATNSAGLVQVLKIPGVISSGLVQLDALNYGASVRAAAGTPSAAPAVTTPTFTVRIFDNGNRLGAACAGATAVGISASRSGAYCNLTVNPATAGFTGRQITLTHNFTQLLGLNLVNLAYTTTIDLLPAAKSGANGVEGPNGERRWSAEYTPLAVTASLNSSVLGIDLIDADVELNLGRVKAEACAGATCL